jgi:hypothetical protein
MATTTPICHAFIRIQHPLLPDAARAALRFLRERAAPHVEHSCRIQATRDL